MNCDCFLLILGPRVEVSALKPWVVPTVWCSLLSLPLPCLRDTSLCRTAGGFGFRLVALQAQLPSCSVLLPNL